MHTLRLYEELMLLALSDERGTISETTNWPYAVVGGVLAELLLAGRLRTVSGDDGGTRVEVVDATPVGEPLLDEAQERLAKKGKPVDMADWLGTFAGLSGLQRRVAERLVERGILRMEKERVLLLFHQTVYPELDPKPEREVIARLERAIFTDEPEIDSRTAILVALAQAGGLLPIVFDAETLADRTERIEEITAGRTVGEAARAAVEAAEQAAALIATMTVLNTTVFT